MSDLGQIWTELEAELPDGRAGRARRRVHADGCCDQTVELTAPDLVRSLCLSIPTTGSEEYELPDPSAGIACNLVRAHGEGRSTIELTLADPNSAELFTAVASDIAAIAGAAPTESEGISTWLGRVRRWQRLLQRMPQGLSPERQRGLWGELWFLREVLGPRLGSEGAVTAWTGSGGGPHDFHIGEGWAEIKTTASNRPQVVRINGERQLDSPEGEPLHLAHISIDVREGAGETLPDMVAAAREGIKGTSAEGLFEDRLLGAGYADIHAHRYRRVGYAIRSSDAYAVLDGFPRLTEGDLPDGVGGLQYRLSIPACGAFRREMDAVFAGMDK